MKTYHIMLNWPNKLQEDFEEVWVRPGVRKGWKTQGIRSNAGPIRRFATQTAILHLEALKERTLCWPPFFFGHDEWNTCWACDISGRGGTKVQHAYKFQPMEGSTAAVFHNMWFGLSPFPHSSSWSLQEAAASVSYHLIRPVKSFGTV